MSSGNSAPSQLRSRGYRVTAAEMEPKKVEKCLLFHLTHKKGGGKKKKKPSDLGPDCLVFIVSDLEPAVVSLGI